MKLKKIQRCKDEWVAEIRGHDVPVFEVLRAMSIFILIAVGINVGAYTATEGFKTAVYLADQGIATHPTLECTPLMDGGKIVWDCKNKAGVGTPTNWTGLG